jgi:glycosyltransferase involved in cell wall biosynthesis
MKKILFICPKPPYPLDDGGKIRIFQSLYFLSKRYEVDLLYIYDNENVRIINEGIQMLVNNIFPFRISKYKRLFYGLRFLLNKKPIRNNMLYSREIQRWIDKHICNYDTIFCQTLRMAEYFIKHPSVKRYVDFVDAVSMNYEKTSLRTSLFRSFYYKIDFSLLTKYEDFILNQFDKCSIISQVDKDYIERRQGKKTKLKVVGNMVSIPTKIVHPSSCANNILFVGKMSYEPNVLAVTNFVENIFPSILESYPDAKFYIVGATPANRIKALANDNIIVTGFVDDLFEYYSKAAIVIAPMISGAGIQNKIIQAMSFGCCVLTTTIGTEGLSSIDSGLIVGDSHLDIAEKIKYLLSHSAERDSAGLLARNYVISTMREDVVYGEFCQFIDSN